jgi:hypothetical protein
MRVDVKDFESFDATGKKADADTLAARLKKNPTVLVSFHGEVDPFYLRVVKEDTLILVVNQPLKGPPKIEPPKK